MDDRRALSTALLILVAVGCVIAVLATWQHLQRKRAADRDVAARGERQLDDQVNRLRRDPEIEITAGEMLKTCENAVACDQRFKGRTIRTTGKMTRIEVSDQYRIVRIEPSEGSFADIDCVSLDEDSVLGALQVGSRVFVRGIGAGMNGPEPVLAPCLVEH